MEVFLLDTKVHNRSKFSCEEESLTDYLKKQASQDVRKKLAACFVLVDTDNDIIGYYTLSNSSLGRDEIPEEHKKKVPQNYLSVPVTLLGRLARDISTKRTEKGEYLLLDALKRSYDISLTIGSMAVIVDPINENAVKFYSKYGFIMLPDSGKMFITMKTIAEAFK